MNSFDSVVSSIRPTELELQILAEVKEGIERDSKESPFSSKPKWYTQFTNRNKVNLTLAEAPINTLLMVVSEALDTFYANGRGTGINRGSVIVKLSDSVIYCVDAYYWYASPSSGAVVYPVKGYYEYDPKRVYGAVKELSKVSV